ncbi:MAG: hypothetical protein EXS08_10985 [Planctomycetes bacterium]|nr:hypothetical protein [Planctomycetota bacterium]
MTIVTNNRSRLDSALRKKGATLMLILDDPAREAEDVHDKAVEVGSNRPWWFVFLITDARLLSAQEKKLWFAEPGYYAVVGGKDKVVAIRGPVHDLIMSDGKPSGVEIRWAFNQGDLLP